MKIETISAYLLTASVAANVASQPAELAEAVPVTDENPNVVEEGAIGANEVVQYTNTLSTAIPLSAADFSSGGRFYDGVLTEGSYQLSENISLSKGIVISDLVELNLAGFTLDGSKISTADKSVITITETGDLTLQGTGTITGGAGTTKNSQQYGGGIYVQAKGSFTMEGGTIANCTATSGAGVFLEEEAMAQLNGGTISANTASLYGGGVYLSNKSNLIINSGTITGNTANTTGSGIAIYNGYLKLGSGAKISGNRNKNDISIVSNTSSSLITLFSGFQSADKVYFARYYADTATATYQGGTLLSGATASNVTSFASTSDAFEVLMDESGMVSLNAVAYTVNFYDPDSKTSLSTQTVKQGNSVSKPSNPTKEGYTFEGWYADSNYITAFDFNSSSITENTTIYAKWSANDVEVTSYTVLFNLAGASGSVPSQTVAVGGYAVRPVDPGRGGYIFDGWYADSEYTEEFDFNVRVTANTTVYAKWVVNEGVTLEKFNVIFVNKGERYAEVSVTEGDLVTSPPDPTQDGEIFLGWYGDANLETLFDFNHTVIDSHTFIYSKWEADSSYHTISFSTGLGTAVTSQTVKDGNFVVEPASPSRVGYTFGGWYTDSDCTDKFSFTKDAVTASGTLYAKWDLIVNATLTGFVMDENGYGVSDASVRFLQNGRTVFQTTTDSMGIYNVENPIEGSYNMVVTHGTTTKTLLVNMLDTDHSFGSFIMPDEPVSSVVTILDSSVSVVGGIHSVAEELLMDITTAFSDMTTEIKVNTYYDVGFEDAIEEYKHRDHTVARYYDIDLNRRITSSTGYSTKTVDETDQLVSIIIDLPSMHQGKDEYAVYMEVDGKMRELSTYANKDGEYITLMSNGTQLALYTKHFSPIAIAYANPDLLGDDDYEYEEEEEDTGEFYLHLSTSLDGSFTSSGNPGTVSASNRYPDYMEKVYINTTTNLGYNLAAVTAVNDRGETVIVRKVTDDLYYYVQDLRPVTVTAAYSSTYVPSQEAVSNSSFDDVLTSDAYCSAIHEVVQLGLMQGTGLRTFSPYESVTRGMLVTILYQLAEETEHYGTTEFPDVSIYQYYANAVAWAEYTGVVAGYSDGLFRPNQSVSREELAMIYYRFANYVLGTNQTAWLFPLEFNDVSSIHDYALESMTWAVNVNLLEERYQGFIVPQAFATRGEVAVSLVEFMKLK